MGKEKIEGNKIFGKRGISGLVAIILIVGFLILILAVIMFVKKPINRGNLISNFTENESVYYTQTWALGDSYDFQNKKLWKNEIKGDINFNKIDCINCSKTPERPIIIKKVNVSGLYNALYNENVDCRNVDYNVTTNYLILGYGSIDIAEPYQNITICVNLDENNYTKIILSNNPFEFKWRFV